MNNVHYFNMSNLLYLEIDLPCGRFLLGWLSKKFRWFETVVKQNVNQNILKLIYNRAFLLGNQTLCEHNKLYIIFTFKSFRGNTVMEPQNVLRVML